MKKGYPKIKKSIWAVVAVILFCLPGLRLPYLDQNADVYFTKAISKAGTAYAICRGINAGVSVIKESQLHLSLGAGVSLAAGQILDPLDDLTERTSDILITAIVSLGIQKIVYELCLWLTPFLLAAAIVVLIVISFFHWEWSQKLQRIILKVIFHYSVVSADYCIDQFRSGSLLFFTKDQPCTGRTQSVFSSTGAIQGIASGIRRYVEYIEKQYRFHKRKGCRFVGNIPSDQSSKYD